MNPTSENELTWEPDHPGFEATLHLIREEDTRAGWLEYHGPAPDPVGGVRVLTDLPAFARGLSIGRFKPHWTAPTFTSDYRTLSARSLLLLWRRIGDDDTYHLLVPLSGGVTVGELGNRDSQFGIHLSTHCRGTDTPYIPVFALASGDDPYQLAERALKLGQSLPHPPRGLLRTQKPYPEPFRYLGWCSWNTYHQEVSEEKVLAAVASLREKEVPVRWVLVDDGWMISKGRRLAGFDATGDKFPGGLAHLVSTLEERHGITWVGVWHTLQGYWDGVAPGLSEAVLQGRESLYLPHPERAEEFFSQWYSLLEQCGIDFVKVDNQARNARFTEDVMPLFKVSEGLHQGLENAARRRLSGGVLNCMDQAPETAFNWTYFNLARNSEDYIPEEPWNPSDHVFQNAYSAFWTANFAYPDYDMFETHHPAARFHATARAISGGPIYTTDTPGMENADLLKSLCLSDGLLLRPDRPAQITRDCLLTDPSLEPVPLKLFAPVRDTGMVAVFNVNKTAPQVTGVLSAADLEGLRGPFVCYRRGSGEVRPLTGPLDFSLTPQSSDLFTLAPLRGGAAVLGLLDKLIGPAAVGEVIRQDSQLSVEVLDRGVLGIYLEQPPRGVGGAMEWTFQNHLLRARVRQAGTVRVEL